MSGIQNQQARVRNGRNRNRGRGRQNNNHTSTNSLHSNNNGAAVNGAFNTMGSSTRYGGYGNGNLNHTVVNGMHGYNNNVRINSRFDTTAANIHQHGYVPDAVNYAGRNAMHTYGNDVATNSGFTTPANAMNPNSYGYGGFMNSASNTGYGHAANAAFPGTGGRINDVAANGTFSPPVTMMQRRQSLREDSVQDPGPSYTHYGPVGGALSAPFIGGTSALAAAASSSSALRAILAAGPVTVSITAERSRPNAHLAAPAFLHGFAVTPATHASWTDTVLPHISTLTFTASSTTDLHHFANMLSLSQLPFLHQAITRVAFPGFYWFSGVAHNRRENPYFVLAKHLSALSDMSLRLHTAGITMSRFGEREMLRIEALDPERAKERKVMLLEDVVGKYDLGAIFACAQLRRVRVEFIDCARTRYFTRSGDIGVLLREIQMWLVDGCAQAGLDVVVELERVE